MYVNVKGNHDLLFNLISPGILEHTDDNVTITMFNLRLFCVREEHDSYNGERGFAAPFSTRVLAPVPGW